MSKDEQLKEAFKRGMQNGLTKEGQNPIVGKLGRLLTSPILNTTAGGVHGAMMGGAVGGPPGAAVGGGIGAGFGYLNNMIGRGLIRGGMEDRMNNNPSRLYGNEKRFLSDVADQNAGPLQWAGKKGDELAQTIGHKGDDAMQAISKIVKRAL